jgi:hypothetical protein
MIYSAFPNHLLRSHLFLIRHFLSLEDFLTLWILYYMVRWYCISMIYQICFDPTTYFAWECTKFGSRLLVFNINIPWFYSCINHKCLFLPVNKGI